MPLRRTMVIASLTTALLLLGSIELPAASAAANGETVHGEVSRDEAAEVHTLRDLQAHDRVVDSVPAQRWSTNLAAVVSRRSHQMAQDSSSVMGTAAMCRSDTDDDYGTHVNQGYNWLAENIGWTTSTPENLNQAWLNSPPHDVGSQRVGRVRAPRAR